MNDSIKTLLENFQVRKTKHQKNNFKCWLGEHLSSYGYVLKEDRYSKSGANLIVGDVGSADIIITAHYDTPPNAIFPILMMFSNWATFILSQIVVLIPIFLILFIYVYFNSTILVTPDSSSISFPIFAPILILLAYAIQIAIGFANKHTANDNTSGVATLISILEKLNPKHRGKVCAVFFDQEELGLIGSSRFYKKYNSMVKNKPVINFDCVSDGDTLCFVCKKAFRKSKYNEILSTSIANVPLLENKHFHVVKAINFPFTSDQLNFPHGVGVVAAKRVPVLGYYIDKIHTSLDTKFDENNIDTLTNVIVNMMDEN